MKIKYKPRKYYIDKIKPFIGKGIIKVITGQRRVGKSYLLYQIIDTVEKEFPIANILYIDKEKYEFDSIKNYKDLIDYCNQRLVSSGKNFLFIDEVQDILEFEKALRHYHADSNIDIYCTGSNTELLSGELAGTLSGRYIEIKVYSLSYSEFIQFHEIQDSAETLNQYLNIGGLPYLVNLKKDENIVYDYLSNIFSTIIYKDIISRYNIRNTYFLENLVKYLAFNTGNLISAKKISDYLKSQNLKMSPQIVIDYLSYLEKAFLLYKVKRTDLTGKRIFEINEKYYFEDWGLKNAITGRENFSINQVIENVLFIYLKIKGYNVYVGNVGDKEIDFICEKQGKKIYIQAAYLIPDDKVREREFSNMLKINDNYPKYVVSMDEFTIANYKGIAHYNLRKFLNEDII